MKDRQKTLGGPQSGPVTRAQLMAMLRRERLGISEHTVRRYQALGLLPPPRAYGRPGRGKGVTWGWTQGEAADIVRRVRIIRRHRARGARLLRLITVDPELVADFDEVLAKEQDIAYKQGYAAGVDDTRRDLEAQLQDYLLHLPRRPSGARTQMEADQGLG